MPAPRIDGDRLWARLMEMARIGATPAGGCNRQALTDGDARARALFADWARAAGCTVRTDAIGNMFARRPGRRADAAPVLIGSHLDTQPTGGRFDGVLGVLAALAAVEALDAAGVATERPVEVVNWCNEEGCRFPVAMMGSAVWAGRLGLDAARALADPAGATVGAELARTGQAGPEPAAAFPVHAAFELHIEQGPVLETSGAAIGIVTGVQAMSRHEIRISGQEAHAGPTPMQARRDPMRALAGFLPRLYALAAEAGEDARITFGVIGAEPASSNTVPGLLRLTVDIRHPEQPVHDRLVAAMRATVAAACDANRTPAAIAEFFAAPAVAFDPGCVAAVEAAAAARGLGARRIVSGAGHDACNLAHVAPTAMIFVPCRDGISHNEAESIEPDQALAGAEVLLGAALAAAGGG